MKKKQTRTTKAADDQEIWDEATKMILAANASRFLDCTRAEFAGSPMISHTGRVFLHPEDWETARRLVVRRREIAADVTGV